MNSLIQNTANKAMTVELSQNGNDNTQIGYVGKYENTTVIVQPQPTRQNRRMPIISKFNNDFYNLFVIGTEEYQDYYFMVPKDRALTESTPHDIKDICDSLSPHAIELIKTFPTIFASKNHGYAKTDDEHTAYFGCVTGIENQDEGIKVYYCILDHINQQKLNDIVSELGIDYAKACNEFDRTHWAIKKVNLLEKLERADIDVFKK